MRRTVLLIALLSLGLGACAGDRGAVIDMREGQRFAPDELAVDIGQKVTWSNESAESHTVTAYEDSLPEGTPYFSSAGAASEAAARADVAGGLLKEGETFQMTFDVPGTYRYFCIPHEGSGMTGTIVVSE